MQLLVNLGAVLTGATFASWIAGCKVPLETDPNKRNVQKIKRQCLHVRWVGEDTRCGLCPTRSARTIAVKLESREPSPPEEKPPEPKQQKQAFSRKSPRRPQVQTEPLQSRHGFISRSATRPRWRPLEARLKTTLNAPRIHPQPDPDPIRQRKHLHELVKDDNGSIGVEFDEAGLISKVEESSPAAKVGLKIGSRIYKVEDRRVDGFEAITGAISRAPKKFAIKVIYNYTVALLVASRAGDVAVVKELVAGDNAQVNGGDANGYTSLMIAAKHNQIAVMKTLLAAPDIDVNAKSGNVEDAKQVKKSAAENSELALPTGESSVSVAVSNVGHEKRGHGYAALMIAAQLNHVDAVKVLLAAPGIDVNAKSSVLGRTALAIAVMMDHPEIVRELMAAPHIHIHAQDFDGWTPVMFTCGLPVSFKNKNSQKMNL